MSLFVLPRMHVCQFLLPTTGHVTRFDARRGVIDIGAVAVAVAVLVLLLRRLLRRREAGFLASAFQRRHPAVATPSRGGVASDAIGVVVLGFGAGEGSDFVRLQVDDRGGPAAVDVRVEVLLFELVEVGARVGGFVFEHLHEAVEARG